MDGQDLAEAEAEADVNGDVELAIELGNTVASLLLSKGAGKILEKVLQDRHTTLVPTETVEEQTIKGWNV